VSKEIGSGGPVHAQCAGIVTCNVKGRDPGLVAKQLYERERILVSAGYCGSPLAAEFVGLQV
jgi:hypothetical protein